MSPAKHSLNPLHRRGMTLLELSLVITLLMGLISIMFVAVNAWRSGSDRSKCIMNIRTMQLSVRSYQNMYGYSHGGNLRPTETSASILEVLRDQEFINEYLYSAASGSQPCPSGDSYIIAEEESFPAEGVLYMSCSLATSRRHVPDNHASW